MRLKGSFWVGVVSFGVVGVELRHYLLVKAWSLFFCVSWVWGECGYSWLYVIVHKQIRAYTPRHKGKVERSHRKDNERFYSKHSFYSLADLQDQLKRYNREYNQTPMRALGWKSPNHTLLMF